MRKLKSGALLLISFIFLSVSPVSVFAQATLALSPTTGTLNTGCSYSVDVLLNTNNNNTDGTDVIIPYDQTRFNITSITPGTLYSDYPAHDFSNNQISISGLASPTQAYNSGTTPGKFATINFTIPANAPAGAANLNIEFLGKGVTTDSNVVKSVDVVDILDQPNPGNFTIAQGTGSCSGVTGGGTGIGTGTGTGGISSDSGSLSSGSAGKGGLITKGGLSNSADTAPTVALTIVGSLLSVMGVAGLLIFR